MTTIRIKADKITAFLHIPVYVPTISVLNPNKKRGENDNKIFLPEAIFTEYRNFIIQQSPEVYQILEKGIDDEHKDKGIIYHLIIKKEDYKKFIELVTTFEKKYKTSVEFGDKLYSAEEIIEKNF